MKRGGILASLVAAAAGAGITILIATAGAGAANSVTVGSTIGNPTGNICPASINCTYLPYLNGTPALQVPLDGTVTSFSVNAGSTGGKVELRVLRPAGGGGFKGAGTSPAETITNTGGQTFNLSSPLPVK